MYSLYLRFDLGAFFRTCVSPEGLAKEAPKVLKIPKSLDLIACTLVLTKSTFKFKAKNSPHALEHLSDLFWTPINYLAVVWLLKKLYSFLSFSVFVLGPFFENVLSPKGWQKNSKKCKIPKCCETIDFPMILRISICNFDAKTTPDAFKYVPDLFWRLRDRKTRKNTKTLKNLKLVPKKPLGISND